MLNCRADLPGLYPDVLPVDFFYLQYPPAPVFDLNQFAPRGSRAWTAEDLDTLKRGLLNISNDTHYASLRDKYYWVSHYIMDGKFTKDNVRKQIVKMARKPERYA